MAAILVDDSFKCILLNEHDMIAIPISLKFILRSLTDNNPLTEPMVTQFTDAYMQR